MTGFVLTGGTVLTPDGPTPADVRISGPQVTEVAPNLVPTGSSLEKVVSVDGLIVGPGLVDLHVHFREPGEEWKEDIASGSAAAAAGGFTAVQVMPNTCPPIDTGHLARYVAERGQQVGLVEVVPTGCITDAQEGFRLARLDELYEAGVRFFTDDGRTVSDSGLVRQAMEYLQSRGGVVAQHAEDPGLSAAGHMHEGAISSLLGIAGIPPVAETVVVARDLTLAAITGGRYHIQHVSCAETVDLIRRAKQKGLPVTAEVTPHHLALTDQEVVGMNPVYKMYPPLRTEQDRAALVAGLQEGIIDAVATDHAPHASQEKDVPFEQAPRGVIGLETALAVVRTVLDPDPVTLFERMSVTPASITGLSRHGQWLQPGSPANLAVVDWDRQWTIPVPSRSKAFNSPFAERTLRGQVMHTFYEGRPTFSHDNFWLYAGAGGE